MTRFAEHAATREALTACIPPVRSLGTGDFYSAAILEERHAVRT